MTPEQNQANIANAIVWANIASLVGGIMVNIVRHVAVDIHPTEIIFFRNVFAFAMFLPIIYYKGFSFFKTNRLRGHMFRSTTGVTAMVAYFYCIANLNLSVVTALSFTAPLFTAILATILFKDKFSTQKTVALIVGFLGALIILRPGFEGYNSQYLWVLFSAVFWAWSGINIKSLSRTDKPLSITFYNTIFMGIFSLPLAIYFWKTPDMENLFWIFMIALTSNILQYALAKSISLADFSVILPFDFTRLVFTAAIAFMVYNEKMDIYAMVGSTIIISSAAYSAYSENRASKKRRAALSTPQ